MDDLGYVARQENGMASIGGAAMIEGDFNMDGDPAATAVEYLQKLRPGGPWVLTAIVPDKGTQTITATNADEVVNFVRSNNGKKNIYYSVNPTRTTMTKKAAKSDIAAVEYMLADLDPKDDETPEAAKARYLATLETHKPTATAIVDSGNGIQALWRLAEPIKLNGDCAAQIADVEGRMKALMEMMGAKAGTQDICRILRLPGPTNLPNAKKIKEGRVECPTALIRFNGATCSVDDFPAANVKSETSRQPDRRRAALPPMLAALLYVRGSGDYPSRSELLFAFLNAALRQGIDDSKITAATVDEAYSGNGIFEHVRENGGEDYVKGQIEHALNDMPAAKTGKAIIRCKKGELHDITDLTQAALIAARCPIYYRGGVLVEPIWRWEKNPETNRDTLTATLVKLNPARLSYMTGKHAAIYQKYNAKDRRWEAINPPKEMIEQLLDLGHWGFHTVKGIINSPTMRPDGSLLTEPGYDPTTQLWYKSSGDIELPVIPDRPTKDEAQRALKLLQDLLVGFPFNGDISKSVAIAGLMTPVLRGAFEFAPMFLILAPEAGTGKTHYANTTGTLATGRLPSPVPMVENKEELDKRLTAALFGAKPILHLNNLDFDLESSLLNQVITEGTVEIRPFGKNDQTIICDCRGTTVFVNGNNIRIVGDLVRRTLTARMDAKSETPETRTFKFDPVDLVKADRGKYLAAIFTIVRAYLAADCPRPNKMEPLAGFTHWSRTVREPLMWLSLADPVRSMANARALDPKRDALRSRIDGLAEAFGIGKAFTAADVDRKFKERVIDDPVYPALVEGFARTDGKPINSKAIGNQLTKDLDRVIGGRWIELLGADVAHEGHRYKVCSNKKDEAAGSEPKCPRDFD